MFLLIVYSMVFPLLLDRVRQFFFRTGRIPAEESKYDNSAAYFSSSFTASTSDKMSHNSWSLLLSLFVNIGKLDSFCLSANSTISGEPYPSSRRCQTLCNPPVGLLTLEILDSGRSMKFFSLDVNKSLFNKKRVNSDSWFCAGCGAEATMWLWLCVTYRNVLIMMTL